MQSKKYYSISEVTKILQIPAYSLRYLEKTLPNFSVQQVRGRRYYSNQDIEILRQYITSNSPSPALSSPHSAQIIQKIDDLIAKFRQLSIIFY